MRSFVKREIPKKPRQSREISNKRVWKKMLSRFFEILFYAPHRYAFYISKHLRDPRFFRETIFLLLIFECCAFFRDIARPSPRHPLSLPFSNFHFCSRLSGHAYIRDRRHLPPYTSRRRNNWVYVKRQTSAPRANAFVFS